MEVTGCDGGVGEEFPLDFGRDDVEEDGGGDVEVEKGEEGGFVDCETVADSGAAVVACEDYLAGSGGGGGEDGGEGLQDCGAGGFGGVGGCVCWEGTYAVAGEFGDEEGVFGEKGENYVAPALGGGCWS